MGEDRGGVGPGLGGVGLVRRGIRLKNRVTRDGRNDRRGGDFFLGLRGWRLGLACREEKNVDRGLVPDFACRAAVRALNRIRSRLIASQPRRAARGRERWASRDAQKRLRSAGRTESRSS